MQSDSAASLNPHANIAERPHGRSGTVGTAVPFRFVGPAIAVQIGSSETGKALRRPIDGPLRIPEPACPSATWSRAVTGTVNLQLSETFCSVHVPGRKEAPWSFG